MVLDQDVYTKDARLLVAKGTSLNNHIIMKLLEFGVFNVKVKDNLTRDNSFTDFTNTYERTMGEIKSSFRKIRYKQSLDISEFENIVDELINKHSLNNNILSYIKLIEQKDEYTFQHSINVSISAMLLGKWLGYKKDAIKHLGVAAVLHDIGKIMIPDSILNKPDKLTNMEYRIMMDHSKRGFELLKNSGISDETLRRVVLTHHERLDGRGYPFGLKGSFISENSRIVAICDVYDAVTSKRVYKPKESPLKGLKIIFDESYNGLDPYLCKIFLKNVVMTYHGCNALLSDGRIGKIIRIFPENPAKPWVVINGKLFDLASCSNIDIVDIL